MLELIKQIPGFLTGTLLPAIVVAVPTSLLSVYFALRKYRSEKWWDKKTESYLEIVGALNGMIRYCDRFLDEALDGKYVSEEQKSELDKIYHDGKALLETQTNIGRLLLSEPAYKNLLTLDLELSKSERLADITKQVAEIRGAVEDCLHSLIPNARKDLRVK